MKNLTKNFEKGIYISEHDWIERNIFFLQIFE